MKCRVSNFKWIELKWNVTHFSTVDVKWNSLKCIFSMKFHWISMDKKGPLMKWNCCLLRIDKARAKDKTYIWFSFLKLSLGSNFSIQSLDRESNESKSEWYHLCLLLLVRQTGYIVNLSDFYSYRLIEKLTAFLQLQEFSQRNPPVSRSTSAARLSFNSSKSKVDLALVKASALRINLNLDGETIASKSHTHPSHSQTSRLLTSSLSLGVPVPRPTQCVWGA
jgi:hypothetical protein